MPEFKDAEGGFAMVPNWLIRDSNLTKNELLVYLALLNRADRRTGNAWPSIRTLARESRVSERTVQATIVSLERRGLLTKQVRPRGDGTNESNMYKIVVFENTPPNNPAIMAPPPVRKPRGGATTAPTRVQPLHPQGAAIAWEEHPLEEDPDEEDQTWELPPPRAGFNFIDDEAGTTCTPKQYTLLLDLDIHMNNQITPPARAAEFSNLTKERASDLIRRFFRDMPRYDEYQGPECGTAEYEALSPIGRQWADSGMIPDFT